jgi:cytochrome b561
MKRSASVIATAPVRYDPRSIWLHWITAALVVALWCLGETIDWFPKGDARVAARSTHITLGALLAIVLCIRIWWRAGGGRRLPAADVGILLVMSKGAHYALYVLVTGTVAIGLFYAWVRGDNIFNLFSIPAFDPGNRELRHQVEELHSWSANILLVLAGLHAAAGLAHHFIWKDGVLRRMLPSRRGGSSPLDSSR